MEERSRTADEPDMAARLGFLRTCVGEPAQVVETHMSWVVLGPQRVLKFKKAVRSPMLDFMMPAAREANVREEFRLNQALAPGVYLGVFALQWDGRVLTLSPDAPSCAGQRTLDWLVSMRRLPDERLLDRMLAEGRAGLADIDAVVRLLVPFYRDAPRPVITVQAYLQQLRQELSLDREILLRPGFDLPAAGAVLDQMDLVLTRFEPAVAERVEGRRLVDGHGDLRPEHVCLLAPPVIIDRLEFSARLRQVDPFFELAFLGLECEMAGAAWVGPRIVARCTQALGDDPGEVLLAVYSARCALLRARLAMAHLLDAEPRLAGKWPPLARRYLARAAAGLDGLTGVPSCCALRYSPLGRPGGLMPAVPHGSS